MASHVRFDENRVPKMKLEPKKKKWAVNEIKKKIK